MLRQVQQRSLRLGSSLLRRSYVDIGALCGSSRCFATVSKVDKKIGQISTRSAKVAGAQGTPAKKVQHQSHSRTHWYMCGVPGITDGPTALGYVPEEFQPQRKYIHDKSEAPPQTHVHMVGKYDAAVHPGPLYYLVPAEKREVCPYDGLKVLQSEVEGFTRPKLAISAFTVGQAPPIRSHTRDVEIVFCGRSNVGKSSLLNTLTNSHIAHAAQTPGKTQSLNFYALAGNILAHHKPACTGLAYAAEVNPYDVQDFFHNLKWGLDQPMEDKQKQLYGEVVREHGNAPLCYLVDVPGYGFAKAPQANVDHWNAQIGGYMRLRAGQRYPLKPESSQMYLDAIETQKKNRQHMKANYTAKADTNEQALLQVEQQVISQLYSAITDAGLDVGNIDESHQENLGVENVPHVLKLQRQRHVDKQQKVVPTTPATIVPPYSLTVETTGTPLKLVIVLVDPVLGLDKHDLGFLDFLEQFGIPYQLVLTKVDSVSEHKLEGAALSLAQTMFPHVYNGQYAQKRVAEGTATLPLLAQDKVLKKKKQTDYTHKPVYNMTANEEAVWVRATETTPRKHCSPVLLAISSQKKLGIQTLKKAILNAIYTHV